MDIHSPYKSPIKIHSPEDISTSIPMTEVKTNRERQRQRDRERERERERERDKINTT